MGADDRVDVLAYDTGEGVEYRTIEAGDGEAVVRAHEGELRKRRRVRLVALGALALASLGYGVLTESLFLGVAGAVVVAVATVVGDAGPDPDRAVPELVERDVSRGRAGDLYDFESEE